MFDSTVFEDLAGEPALGEPALGDTALGHLRAGVAQLRSEERAGWSSAARSTRVLEIGRAVEVLQAELVRAVAVWDGAGDYAADGSLTATAWPSYRLPTTGAKRESVGGRGAVDPPL